MFFSKQIGVLLSDESERSLVHKAAAECELEPTDLAFSIFSGLPDGNSDNPGVPADHSPTKASNTPRLIVTDDAAGVLPHMQEGPRCCQRNSSLVLLVRDKVSHSPGSAAASSEMPGVEAVFPWVLDRPLNPEDLKRELRKAAHASRVFAERNQAMLDELDRARRVLDSMSNGVTLSDAALPDHPLVYVNPAFERITGYSFAESCGRNSRFLQNADADQPDLPKIREAITKRTAVQALLKNYRKDGTPFWNELYMSPVFDTDGSLTHFAAFQNDVTLRVETARQAEHLANHDSLTGLPNRALMMESLRQALPRARRAGSHVAVLFFDLNNFKYVNDVYGHEAGDRLLQVIAERLKRDTRSSEVASRIGGDEFVAILEGIATEFQAIDIAERLCSGIAEPYQIGQEEFHPSASVGMAFYPRDGETPQALLNAADAAMYRSKDDFHSREPSVEVGAEDRL
jgi:diguanylate cyclase (GGDEF)-like protein/PAS domain S-box-containing protein